MYNLVKLTSDQKCPKCGHVVTDWQSKQMAYAGYDLANIMRELKLNSHMDGEIHAVCDNCQEYISLQVAKGKIHKTED